MFTQTSAIHGRGLFTNQRLPAQTILCRRLGLRTGLSLRDKRAILGIDGLDPAVPEDNLFKNINHSCRPNAYVTDSGCLVTKETVLENEEIIVDYSILLNGSEWHASCNRGYADCRRVIRSSDGTE